MGEQAGIRHDQFPRQGSDLNQRCQVVFGYDLSHRIGGVIVRDDIEDPYRTVIRLDDGRHVLGTECQYSVEAPNRVGARNSLGSARPLRGVR